MSPPQYLFMIETNFHVLKLNITIEEGNLKRYFHKLVPKICIKEEKYKWNFPTLKTKILIKKKYLRNIFKPVVLNKKLQIEAKYKNLTKDMGRQRER